MKFIFTLSDLEFVSFFSEPQFLHLKHEVDGTLNCEEWIVKNIFESIYYSVWDVNVAESLETKAQIDIRL